MVGVDFTFTLNNLFCNKYQPRYQLAKSMGGSLRGIGGRGSVKYGNFDVL